MLLFDTGDANSMFASPVFSTAYGSLFKGAVSVAD